MVDFVLNWKPKSRFSISDILAKIDLKPGRFYEWKRRYGSQNKHNSHVPRQHWLEPWEREAIIAYFLLNPDMGYRRMAYMMLDKDIVAVSPTTVYNVLKQAGLMGVRPMGSSKKGTGFEQPTKPHEHWHVDIAHINIAGTFYYICTALDGFSRSVIHHEIREKMKEQDVEIILQRAREAFPEASPRIITDNGPQFVARDFKSFIRISGMTHVRTSPYYPQSNGKIERWHKSLKTECIRPKSPISLEDARQMVSRFVDQYNNERLHSGIGYLTPASKMEGRASEIVTQRKLKLKRAKLRRMEAQRSQAA